MASRVSPTYFTYSAWPSQFPFILYAIHIVFKDYKLPIEDMPEICKLIYSINF